VLEGTHFEVVSEKKLRLQHGCNSEALLDTANSYMEINPLIAKLNPICHLLVLLGDLTFMGPCIVSTFQYMCISNKMQRYTVYLYLETALHVSGGTTVSICK
jgi:hypothetical protein